METNKEKLPDLEITLSCPDHPARLEQQILTLETQLKENEGKTDKEKLMKVFKDVGILFHENHDAENGSYIILLHTGINDDEEDFDCNLMRAFIDFDENEKYIDHGII